MAISCGNCKAYCCRIAGRIMKELDRGDGICLYLKSDNKCEIYDSRLANYVKLPKKHADLEYKYPYYVIVLKSVEEKDNVMNTLCENGIYPWHCYYPTLNTLPYLKKRQSCPVAEDVCARILQMPLYYQLETKDIERVCDVTLSVLRG